MKVRDVMSSPVRTVGLDTPLREVAALLSEERISGLPVVDDAGRVVGVVSEGDILFKERGPAKERRGLLHLLHEASATREKLAAQTAREAMSAPAITIDPAQPVSEAASIMLDKRVKRLPVVDDDGQLLGIVTRADLVRAFVRSDPELEREIGDLILHGLWIEPGRVTVTVDSGAVTLAGQVVTRGEAELLPPSVQRVPGVVSVKSTLTWETEENRQDGKLEWGTGPR